MFWLAWIVPLLAQDPVENLHKEIEKLKRDAQTLRERLSEMEQETIENSQTIQRLRQALKILEANNAPKNPGSAQFAKPAIPGPDRPIKGKVVSIDAKMGFVVLGIGKREGVQAGYKFEIFRETYEPGSGDSKLTRVGAGVFDKYMGQDSMSKLTITEGNIADMKMDDLAVAIRSKLPPVAPPTAGTTPPLPSPEGVYAITGRVGVGPAAGFVINYGAIHGARQTDLVFIYKDGEIRAKLRLDKVEKSYSTANMVEGPPPEQGDQVHTKEIKNGLNGKVALLNADRGLLAVDLRKRDGVKVGQRFDVRRQGQKVGTIVIDDVQVWGSWAKPEGGTKIEQFQKGDFVEMIEEK
jgi:hypothetical protein